MLPKNDTVYKPTEDVSFATRPCAAECEVTTVPTLLHPDSPEEAGWGRGCLNSEVKSLPPSFCLSSQLDRYISQEKFLDGTPKVPSSTVALTVCKRNADGYY